MTEENDKNDTSKERPAEPPLSWQEHHATSSGGGGGLVALSASLAVVGLLLWFAVASCS